MKIMRSDMRSYYISRGLIAILFGLLIYWFGGSILAGVLSTAAILAVFIYLPRSGRYRVDPEKGVAPLRRDDWSQYVNQRSGLYAWVVVSITGGALVFYYGLISPGNVPLGVMGALLLLGVLTYYASDFWLCRL
jgi:hypothetical protein